MIMNTLMRHRTIEKDADSVLVGARQLLELGVRPGGVLLVHSSFRAVRRESKSIANVIAALSSTLGDGGTLLLPALSYDNVSRENPVFDLENTPSNIGAIAEFFRKLPATARSVHPTHSVSGHGAAVAGIIGRHHLDNTPVGPHSPFAAVKERGGQILMLGCGLQPNTSMHGVEEFADAPYLLSKDPVTYTIRRGGE